MLGVGKWWCMVGPTLSGDVIGHAGVVLWNVIAHIADIWLIVWALWGEQVQSGVSQCEYNTNSDPNLTHTHTPYTQLLQFASG